MFIKSSTAINDCLIALDFIKTIFKPENQFNSFLILKHETLFIGFELKDKTFFAFEYNSQEIRDKAYDELCAFLNSNYKLRDFS